MAESLKLLVDSSGNLNINGSTYASVSAFQTSLLAALMLTQTGLFELDPASNISDIAFNAQSGLLSWKAYGSDQNVTLTDPQLNSGWETVLLRANPGSHPEGDRDELMLALARLAVANAANAAQGASAVSRQVYELAVHVKNIEEHLPVAAIGGAALGAAAAQGKKGGN